MNYNFTIVLFTVNVYHAHEFDGNWGFENKSIPDSKKLFRFSFTSRHLKTTFRGLLIEIVRKFDVYFT